MQLGYWTQRSNFQKIVLFSGLESELETMKDANDKKLETLESKLVEITAQIVSLKNEGNQEIKDSLKVNFLAFKSLLNLTFQYFSLII